MECQPDRHRRRRVASIVCELVTGPAPAHCPCHENINLCTVRYAMFVVWSGIELQAMWWVHVLPIMLRFRISQIDILLMYLVPFDISNLQQRRLINALRKPGARCKLVFTFPGGNCPQSADLLRNAKQRCSQSLSNEKSILNKLRTVSRASTKISLFVVM